MATGEFLKVIIFSVIGAPFIKTPPVGVTLTVGKIKIFEQYLFTYNQCSHCT